MLLFLQKRPGVMTEQLGCIAMNVWQMKVEAGADPWVCPVIPFAPRDNKMVESEPNQPWDKAILAFYERPATDIFAWEGRVDWRTLEEFWKKSGGRVCGPAGSAAAGSNPIKISKRFHCLAVDGEDALEFIHDPSSPYRILPLPQRWDILARFNKKNFSKNFQAVYESLPFRIRAVSTFARATLHWRRGDRGNIAALGEYANYVWNATMPVTVGDWIAPILLEYEILELVIMTNSGNSMEQVLLEKTIRACGFEGKIRWLLPHGDPLDSWINDLSDLIEGAGSGLICLSPGGVGLSGSAFGRILVAETIRNDGLPVIKEIPLC